MHHAISLPAADPFPLPLAVPQELARALRDHDEVDDVRPADVPCPVDMLRSAASAYARQLRGLGIPRERTVLILHTLLAGFELDAAAPVMEGCLAHYGRAD